MHPTSWIVKALLSACGSMLGEVLLPLSWVDVCPGFLQELNGFYPPKKQTKKYKEPINVGSNMFEATGQSFWETLDSVSSKLANQ